MKSGEWLEKMPGQYKCDCKPRDTYDEYYMCAIHCSPDELMRRAARALAKELREWILAEGEVHSEEVKKKLTELVGEEK